MEDPFDSVYQETLDKLTKSKSSISQWITSIKPLITSKSLKIQKKNSLLLEYSSFMTDLKGLEWEIAELQETVEAVKCDRDSFNLLDSDILSRTSQVEMLKREFEKLKIDIETLDVKRKLETPNEETPLNRFASNSNQYQNTNFTNSSNPTPRFNHQQQQIINNQDQKLDLIGESVTALKNMSTNIGDELKNQTVLLDELGTDMNQVSGKTEQVLKRLSQVTHLDTDKRQWWAMLYLGIGILALFFLNIIF